MARNRLEIILSGQVRDFNRSLKEAQGAADEAFGAIGSAAQSAGAAFGGLAISGALLTKSFLDKSVEMAQFRGTLVAVMKDTEAADAALRKMVDFAANTPFDLPGVVSAGVKLTALKADVDRFLPLAGDLAAVFNRDIKDAADALGKSLSGSQDGLTQLADSFGISKREMAQFGAQAKADGSIATSTASDLEKLQNALEKIIQSKYGGAMEAQSKTAAGAFANLSDAIDQLKAALGAELADEFASLAKWLTELVGKFNDLPSATKNMIAWSVVMVTAIGGLGLAASAAVAAFGPLFTALRGLSALNGAVTLFGGLDLAISGSAQAAISGSSGMAALTGTTAASGTAATASATGFRLLSGALMGPAGLIAAGALLVTGAVAITNHLWKTVEAAEQTRVAQQKVADRFRESRDAITEASDALKKYQGDAERAGAATAASFEKAGKDDLDAAKAILALVEQRNEVQTRLDEARENAANLRAKSSGGAFSKQFYAAELAEAEKYVDAQQKLLDDLTDKVKTFYETREALSGTHAAAVEAEIKAEEAKKAALEAAAKALEDYHAKSSAGFYETKREQLAALDQVLAGMRYSDAEYAKLSLSRVKLAREAADEEVKAAEEARKASVDAAMWELDKLKAAGSDNFQQRKAVLAKILAETNLNAEERKKLELELLEVEKTIGEHKVEIAKRTAENKLKAEEAAAKLRLDAARTDKAEADQETDILKEKLDLGEDVLAQLQEQLKARQALTEETINAAAAQDRIGKSAAEQAVIDKQTQTAISMSRKDTARESDAIERKTSDARKKSALEALKYEEELAAAKFAADKNVTQGDLNAHHKERLRLAEEQLRLQAEIDSATALPEERTRVQNKLELDLYNLRKKSTEELAAASAELDKAKKKAEDLNKSTFDGVQTIDDMINDMANLGDIRRRGARKGEGATEGDQRRAAGSLGVNPNELPPEEGAVSSGSGKGSSPSTSASSGSGMGVSKWERERQKAEAEKNGTAAGDSGGGGGVAAALTEGFTMLASVVKQFHADVLAAASNSGTRVEIVTPQGQRDAGWSYRSTRIGE